MLSRAGGLLSRGLLEKAQNMISCQDSFAGMGEIGAPC